MLLGKDNRYHNSTFVPAFVFSTAYALSGFVAAYSWDVMWMDVVAVAPLAIAGLEKLVRDKKPVLYYVSLSLCILSNYYLSIMLCIFLVFWFAWLFFTQKGGKMAAIVRFAVYSLFAVFYLAKALGGDNIAALTEAARTYSAEVEYSDDNTHFLLDYAEGFIKLI